MFVRNRIVLRTINALARALGRGTVAFPPIPADGRICFYKRDRPDFGFLSNFHPAPIRLDDRVWPTVEHYYQAQKCADPAYHAMIQAARTPGAAKKLGDSRLGRPDLSEISWFRRHPEGLRLDWEEIKLWVMRKAVQAKFEQNRELARALLATATAAIVEDSDEDAFWGTGPDGAGANHLGRILEEVRTRLR